MDYMIKIDIDDHLYLRILSQRDTDALYQLTIESKEHLKQWLPWLDSIKTAEDSLQFIKNQLLALEQRKGQTYGIFAQNQLVGVISYNPLDFTNRIGTIGYWIGVHHAGNGYITKATKALCLYGFNHLELNRIEIKCATENKLSQHIPERLGFKKEGVLRQREWLYDHYVDHYLYALLNEEKERLSTEKTEN